MKLIWCGGGSDSTSVENGAHEGIDKICTHTFLSHPTVPFRGIFGTPRPTVAYILVVDFCHLSSRVHTHTLRLDECLNSTFLDSSFSTDRGSSLEDNDVVGKVSRHYEIVLDDKSHRLRV